MIPEEHIRRHLKLQYSLGSISEMKAHQDRVRFHVDGSADSTGKLQALDAFLHYVEGIGLSEEKFASFKSLLRFPLPTSSVSSTVFDRLSRIFEGRNPVYNYQFKRLEYNDDWEWYRQERLGEPEVWRSKGWRYFRTECNSVLVVDMPIGGRTDHTDKYLQPYFYWVTVDNIVDFEADADCVFSWFAYKDELKGLAYVIDDECYRVYNYDGTHGILGDLVSQSRHGLGYCPCRFFTTDSITLSKPFVKESPITKVLADLDWYLYFATSKKNLDSYAAYPILSGYAVDCTYETMLMVAGQKVHCHCRSGIMCDDDDHPIMREGNETMKCPVCGTKRMVGPGSYIEVPDPVSADGHDMRNPVSLLGVDRQSLDYCTQELQRLRKEIIASCVGVDNDTINEFSVSEKQVDATFETQSTVLLRIKKNFEEAQRFVDSTICRLRYGKNFQSCCINYGTEFYTLSTAEMRERLKKAIESGAPESDILSLRKQVIETEYRNNPLQMQRMLILTDVEPLLGMTNEEAKKAESEGYADREDVAIKLNFDSLIRRFERENENVLEFGTVGMSYIEKINKIKETLKTYVREYLQLHVATDAVPAVSDNDERVPALPATEDPGTPRG